MVRFEIALKGHGLGHAVSYAGFTRLYRLREKTDVLLF
jgi:hypothetical protein